MKHLLLSAIALSQCLSLQAPAMIAAIARPIIPPPDIVIAGQSRLLAANGAPGADISSDEPILSENPTEELGCCKGHSAQSNPMCNALDTRAKCEQSSSCQFIRDGDVNVDCVVDSMTPKTRDGAHGEDTVLPLDAPAVSRLSRTHRGPRRLSSCAISLQFESDALNSCPMGWICEGAASVYKAPGRNGAGAHNLEGVQFFEVGSDSTTGDATSDAFFLPVGVKKVQWRRAGGADDGGLLLRVAGGGADICSGENGKNTDTLFDENCEIPDGFEGVSVELFVWDHTSSGWGKTYIDDIHFLDANDNRVDISCFTTTSDPTNDPTKDPTADPSADPTRDPTTEPTNDPTKDPTTEPTTDPTNDPTKDPTADPTSDPTADPTTVPTRDPTADPTADPTKDPTTDPTRDPSADPTSDPTRDPTVDPTTSEPTEEPTTAQPTSDPTRDPTADPTADPTKDPTADPTKDPSADPTSDPTRDPTADPTDDPSADPTRDPTRDPTDDPTRDPTADPTREPTRWPSAYPTAMPSSDPTAQPSADPTIVFASEGEGLESRLISGGALSELEWVVIACSVGAVLLICVSFALIRHCGAKRAMENDVDMLRSTTLGGNTVAGSTTPGAGTTNL